MKKTLLSLLSVFCIALYGNAQTVWASKTTLDSATGNNPYTIATGLIDGDAIADILIGTDTDHVLVWYKGNGDGTFAKQTAITNTLVNIIGVKLVDLDGDTDLDILAVGFGSYGGGDYGSGSSLVWFSNDGSGSFGTEQTITSAYDGMSGVFTGTIDADSTIDIAVTSAVDSEVVWFPNNGSGVFGAAGSIDLTLNSPAVIKLEDVDNDGDLDALVGTAAYSGSDVIEIFRNDLIPGGSVSFTMDATSVTTGKVGVFSAIIKDVDGDSNMDILATDVSCGFCSPTTGNLFWIEEDGMGGYTETNFTTSIANPSVVQFEDIDNDGLNDIILSSGTSGGGNDLVYYKNNGSGSFGTETVIDNTQSQAFVFNVFDYDGDGDMDIASCAYNDDDLNYLENLLETLSVSESELSSIKVFPNPAKNKLSFEGVPENTFSVSITDLLGKVVLQIDLNLTETLDVSNLMSGVYSISINNKFATKFIKE